MPITREGLSVENLSLQEKYLKLQILNFDYGVVGTLEGSCIGGSLTKDEKNPLRRSGSVQLCVPANKSAKTFLEAVDGVAIAYHGKIWIDKFVKIYVGIKSETGGVVWNKFGICLIDKPVRSLSAGEYTISFSILDQMGRYTGDRQGKIPSSSVAFEKGSTIHGQYVKTKTVDALKSAIVDIARIERYTIFPLPQKYKYLPYDIKADTGATSYDILSKFLDILSGWQMYFDDDGVFTVEPIPNGQGALVYPISRNGFTADSLSADFSTVKNQIVVYGRTNASQHFSDNTSYQTSTTLVLNFDTISTDNWSVGATIISFTAPPTYNTRSLWNVAITSENPSKTITCSLVGFNNETSALPGNTLIPGEIYCIRLFSATTNADGKVIVDGNAPIVFEFLGKKNVSWCAVNDNPQSPFYINATLRGKNYYCGTAKTAEEGIYTIRINNDDTAVSSRSVFTFMVDIANSNSQRLTVFTKNGGRKLVDSANIVDRNGSPIQEGMIGADYTIWEMVYDGEENRFVFYGAFDMAMTDVKSGGEYENIYADALALERANYELFQASYVTNNVSISCVPDYMLDVNIKIPYSEADAIPPDLPMPENTETEYYLIDSITYPLGSDGATQSINAVRVYDAYQLVGNDYEIVEEPNVERVEIVKNTINSSIYNAWYSYESNTHFSIMGGATIEQSVPIGVTLFWEAIADDGCRFIETGAQTLAGSIENVSSTNKTITAVAI